MKTKSASLLSLLMALSMGVTFTVAFLLFDDAHRAVRFWLSLGTILFAEFILFLHPISLIIYGSRIRRNIPLHLVPSLLSSGYLIGVLVLAVIATTPISITSLMVLHILLGFALLLGVGGIGLANIYFSKMDSQTSAERKPMITLVNRCAHIRDRLAMINLDSSINLKNDFGKFCDEDLHYATGETVSGAEKLDDEINTCLDEIESRVMSLEGVPIPADQTGETSSDGHAHRLSEAHQLVKRLRQLLGRREALIGELRRA